MEKYKLDLISHIQHEVEAEDVHDAMNQAKEAFPNYRPEVIQNLETGKCNDVTTCDGCGEPLIDDDIASTDDENGNDYCKGCTGAIEHDASIPEVKCNDCGWLGKERDLVEGEINDRCPQCDKHTNLEFL